MSRYRAGFTLVELSIVLVILGLLVGGVLTGQSLIRAAELRSVATQSTSYITAIHTFRDKYFGYHGDITNATSFWGSAAVGAACITTVVTGTQTCDGDGNSIVGHDGSATSNEGFRFWQQLANAGLVEGSYTGVMEGGGVSYAAGPTNAPKGKISASFGEMSTYGTMSANTQWFDGAYGNALQLGGYIAGNSPGNVIFVPADMWNIDTKVDDGKPATGRMVVRVRTVGFSACTNATNSTQLASDYLFISATPGCSLMIRQL